MVGEEGGSKRITARQRLRSKLITKDSFADDFSLKRIKSSLSMTYEEGKNDKAAALKKAGGTKEKDAKADKEAKALLWSFVKEQWPLLLLGVPFMFAGSLIEFLVPSYVGQIINKFRENNFDKDGGVYELLWEWIFFLVISVVCSFFRELIFGVTSQRLGRSIRQRLFDSIISKDVNFFDNFRTGDMLSRLGSDT